MSEALLELLPSVLLEGLLLGCVYAMIALGYTMVYGVLGLINFAHSEVFMVGAVAGVEVYRYLGPHVENPYILALFALVIAAIISGGLAMGIERLAYRPLRKRGSTNRLVPLITAIGVSFFLQDLVRLIEGLWHGEFYMNFPADAQMEALHDLPMGMSIQNKSILVIAVAVIMMLALDHLVEAGGVDRLRLDPLKPQRGGDDSAAHALPKGDYGIVDARRGFAKRVDGVA